MRSAAGPSAAGPADDLMGTIEQLLAVLSPLQGEVFLRFSNATSDFAQGVVAKLGAWGLCVGGVCVFACVGVQDCVV